VNKIRISSEINVNELDLLDTLPGPPWVPAAKSISPKMHLQSLIAKSKSIPREEVTEAMLKAENTLSNRLRWMLTETMGSDGDFERRQEELARCKKCPQEEITDEEVVESFVRSVQPGGCILELLELGVLGIVLGDTLFVHGGLIGSFMLNGESVHSCLGYVPNERTVYNDVHMWVKKLNEWKEVQLREWQASPTWTTGPQYFLQQCGLPDDLSSSLSSLLPSTMASTSCEQFPSKAKQETRKRGGEELISYVVPGSKPSVILGRHLTSKGMPEQMPTEMQQRLQRGVVHRVVLGHTPHGHSPTVIAPASSELGEGVLVVMGDTSFSDMSVKDNRGIAVSHIGISLDIPKVYASLPPAPCTRSSVTVNGVLTTRSWIYYEIKRGDAPPLSNQAADIGDELVGAVVTEELLKKVPESQQPTDPKLPRFVKVPPAFCLQWACELLLCELLLCEQDRSRLIRVRVGSSLVAVLVTSFTGQAHRR
jgi:hypothetical protein